MFTHPLISGDAATALTEPNSILLSRTSAEKLFGNRPALGEALKLNSDDYVVTGVVKDMPHSSHIRFEYIASLVTRKESCAQAWVSNNFYTYLVLEEGAKADNVVGKLNAMVRKYAGPQIKAILNVTFEEFEAKGGRYEFELQALTDVHLRPDFDFDISEANGDIVYVYMFSSVAFLVILVACINYTNLTTARAAKRSTEVGMRKAVGAYRGQLIGQFLGESILQTFPDRRIRDPSCTPSGLGDR